MILLDTDHLSVLADIRHASREQLLERLTAQTDTIALPVIAVEEQLRGWLAQIRRVNNVHKQIVPYIRLSKLIDFLRDWNVVVWNEPAADRFVQLRRQRIRIGTEDLKIASLALANEALLLTANLRDFEQVPGLRVESWLQS